MATRIGPQWKWEYIPCCTGCNAAFPYYGLGHDVSYGDDCPCCGASHTIYGAHMQRYSTGIWWKPWTWFSGYYQTRKGTKFFHWKSK